MACAGVNALVGIQAVGIGLVERHQFFSEKHSSVRLDTAKTGMSRLYVLKYM